MLIVNTAVNTALLLVVILNKNTIAAAKSHFGTRSVIVKFTEKILCRKDGLLLRRLNLLHGKTPLIQYWINIFSSPTYGLQLN